MPTVFVSHAKEDKELRVAPLVKRLLDDPELTRWGVMVWIDRPRDVAHELGDHPRVRGIEFGMAWRTEIQKAIKDADCVLGIWSTATQDVETKRILHDEFTLATYDRKLVPVLLDPLSKAPMPVGLFEPGQAIDLSKSGPDRFCDVQAALIREFSRKRGSSLRSPPPTPELDASLEIARGLLRDYDWWKMGLGGVIDPNGSFDAIDHVLRAARTQSGLISATDHFKLAHTAMSISWALPSRREKNRCAAEHYHFIRDRFPGNEQPIHRFHHSHNLLLPGHHLPILIRPHPLPRDAAHAAESQINHALEGLRLLGDVVDDDLSSRDQRADMEGYQKAWLLRALLMHPNYSPDQVFLRLFGDLEAAANESSKRLRDYLAVGMARYTIEQNKAGLAKVLLQTMAHSQKRPDSLDNTLAFAACVNLAGLDFAFTPFASARIKGLTTPDLTFLCSMALNWLTPDGRQFVMNSLEERPPFEQLEIQLALGHYADAR